MHAYVHVCVCVVCVCMLCVLTGLSVPYRLQFGVKFYAADPCKLFEEVTRSAAFSRDISTRCIVLPMSCQCYAATVLSVTCHSI